AAMAATFGCRRLVATIPGADPVAIARAAGAAADTATSSGVRLCLHPHQGTAVATAADTDRVLAATDPYQVTVCADTGHLLAAGDDPAAAVAAWAPRLGALHLKDIDARGRVVPVGVGRLAVSSTLAAVGRALADGAPLFHLTLEVEDVDDPDTALSTSLTALARGSAGSRCGGRR
ncbi:MAG: sugar phosphate isomerase/epimerase, partial [Actinomycetota bacterium]|nr:sugar phosphate isomerase/epimerase [Actinomycetota bacterium]